VGALVCGEPHATAPDGSLLQRPFRRVVSACSAGCACNASDVGVVSFESCVADPCDYVYSGEVCNVVFNVTSAAEARDLSGLQLRFVPFADGSGFNEPEVVVKQKVLTRLADTDASGPFSYTMCNDQGVCAVREMTHEPAQALCLDEEQIVKVSIMGGSFDFLGETYDDINVAANGYVSFDESSLLSPVSTPTSASHFAASKGHSFSLMLTDLDPPNAFIAHLDERLGDNTTVPFATVITYLNPLVANSPDERRKTPAGCTVQAMFEFDTGAITVTYGGQGNWDCDDLEAFIGPSAGNATNATIDATVVARLSSLLDGSMAPSQNNQLSLCNSTSDDDEEDEYAYADPFD